MVYLQSVPRARGRVIPNRLLGDVHLLMLAVRANDDFCVHPATQLRESVLHHCMA